VASVKQPLYFHPGGMITFRAAVLVEAAAEEVLVIVVLDAAVFVEVDMVVEAIPKV